MKTFNNSNLENKFLFIMESLHGSTNWIKNKMLKWFLQRDLQLRNGFLNTTECSVALVKNLGDVSSFKRCLVKFHLNIDKNSDH